MSAESPQGEPSGISDATRAPGGRRRLWAIPAVLAVCIGAGALVWRFAPGDSSSSGPERSKTAAPDDNPLLAGMSITRPAGFVGPQACTSCHAERVAEFLQTGHARTCRLPEPEEMPPGFSPERGTFETRFPGLKFEMTREGDRFFETAVKSTPSGEERTKLPINLVLGAGTADDVYLSWREDGRMYELPMAWLWTSDEWGAAYFDPHGSENYSRPLTPRCLECHNTWVGHVRGSGNRYSREGLILGVTCERCHGPAGEHVAWHQAHPETEDAEAILHPGTLPRERLIEVCTQCHSNAVLHRRRPFSYRPGEPLEKYYKTLSVEHSEDDHVANQIKYLRQSECFRQSEEMTCITCHDPHRPHGVGRIANPSYSCRQCHQAADCHERPRLPAAVKDRCVNCHMPKYVKINVNFQTDDDNHVPPIRRYEHRIAVHPAATKEVLLDWFRTQNDEQSRQNAARLTGELTDHWLAKAEEYAQQHRYTAAIAAVREVRRLNDTPSVRKKLREYVAVQTKVDDLWAEAVHLVNQRKRPEAAATLEELLKLKPDHDKAHGRLGTLYATMQKKELSRKHLSTVAEHDPDNPYGEAMLGWLAYLDDRYPEALEHYRRADEIEPYNAQIHFQTGLVLEALGHLSEAVEKFKRALEIEPQRVDACRSLSGALLRLEQPEEALIYAQKAAQLSENGDLAVLMHLTEVYVETDRLEEAADTAEIAAKEARRQDSPLEPQVRRRAATLRARARRAASGQ